jgi:hypothetical protein
MGLILWGLLLVFPVLEGNSLVNIRRAEERGVQGRRHPCGGDSRVSVRGVLPGEGLLRRRRRQDCGPHVRGLPDGDQGDNKVNSTNNLLDEAKFPSLAVWVERFLAAEVMMEVMSNIGKGIPITSCDRGSPSQCLISSLSRPQSVTR